MVSNLDYIFMTEETGISRKDSWRCDECGHICSSMDDFCPECGYTRYEDGDTCEIDDCCSDSCMPDQLDENDYYIGGDDYVE